MLVCLHSAPKSGAIVPIMGTLAAILAHGGSMEHGARTFLVTPRLTVGAMRLCS